ncbi:immunoglobulin-like domain-containing protein [Listeria booriae]|uniref:immunoglobulin-like domain-containing protein n=1 Tax=Listeria booriae TaxID=1552123 RepID=UPI0035D876BA
MSSDRVLDINLLGNPEAAQTTLATGLPDSVKPVIDAQDVTLYVGDEYDPKQGVTATDDRDGDVTNLIQVTANDVDTSQVGTYHVTYSVKDTAGNIATKTITVAVAERDWANYKVGNVTDIKLIMPGATTIEGQTDYDFNSQIPEGTKIYAEAVRTNDGFNRSIGLAEIKYGTGTFSITVYKNVKLAEGDKIGVYLSAINGVEAKSGPTFMTVVSANGPVSE